MSVAEVAACLSLEEAHDEMTQRQDGSCLKS